jgi:acyl-CoA synthetase (AMP-forming)/AMP-acid ligase II
MPCGKDGLGNVTYSHYTFIELEKRINQMACALKQLGIKKGNRVLLFIKPSLDFSAIAFALFKMGAVPVLIDPGMGIKKFLTAVKEVKAHALIGIHIVHILRRLFRSKFSSIKIFISTSPLYLLTPSLPQTALKMGVEFEAEKMQPSDTAAILFTSGGTGKPKGVVYTHEIFIAQTQMLRTEFGLTPDDMDIPGFPLFALFSLAIGMSSCIPEMNPSKPAKANPEKLVMNISDQGATFVAGSPAIWQKVADYCIARNLTLPTIKYLVMFGAPISVELHQKFAKILPNGTTYTPYGATECLPITNMSGTEILKDTRKKTLEGMGTCVGLPVSQVQVEIIPITDQDIAEISEIQFLPAFSKGEIIVKSPVVTPEYFLLPEKTKAAKINDQGKLWHRMGDVGYKDDKGRLWFCGRKAHVVTIGKDTYFPIPVEAVFNQHPEVKRSALVQLNSKQSEPGLVIERKDKQVNMSEEQRNLFFAELLKLAARYEHTKSIQKLFLYKDFPVDVRHNIKIDRKLLSKWANTQKQ